MGRNGRSSAAPAMLSMLPKLELVPMRMYLSVLAKVRRPSRTPCGDGGQARLQEDDVGRRPRHVGGVVDADAHVRDVERRRVVDAVAEVAHDRAPRPGGRG